MNKFFTLIGLFLLLGCDDGDLQVETLDFDPDSVASCPGVTTLLFNINGDEAMILTLDATFLVNEETVDGTPRTGTIADNNFEVSLRIFSATVSSTYFCSDIPQTEPTVISELLGLRGNIEVTTSGEDTDADMINDTFNHIITFKDVVFENERNGQRLIDETYIFGNFTTTL